MVDTKLVQGLGLACCGAACGGLAAWAYRRSRERFKVRHAGEPQETPGIEAECGPIQSPRPMQHVRHGASL